MTIKVQGNTAHFTRMKKDAKKLKKDLTSVGRCGNIVKLSQREGAKEPPKAAREREKSWRRESPERRQEQKNLEKKMKKVLDKADSM